MRQAIEAQLNRIEESNNFTRAVAVGNPRGFRQGEKEGQELAEGCNRLIRNSIVVWNYLWLTRKLATTDSAQARQALLNDMRSRSPMSWEHVNMLGEYDFSEEKLRDALGILPPKSGTR